ncbi:hypothetical protein B0A55_10877 [Friedmanniomyces simplex]|uniref:SMP-LTD domain-containing protein n=1 Tax=Friedmanniomyces simplex TaxID=329884 RepID=A0A4U0WW24_9PEZI|nr:hypothetical protein B0A55_10877 [Friedmanniomyces simplex]
MNFTTFVVVYILGGLTFLPLLVAAVLIPAWLLLPRTEDGHAARLEARSAEKEAAAGQVLDDDAAYEGSAAADATFAVLRSYHFPSALAALNARAAGSNGAVAGTSTTSSVDGSGAETGGSGGGSVYQSMYRTVFDRGKTGATTSVLEKDGEDVTAVEGGAGRLNRKAVVSASVFYIVLRHGHLMLYDSAVHTEVRHVISLAHHTISLTDGEQVILPDSDLFIKRTAIVLTPLHAISPNGNQSRSQAQLSAPRPKPFYLFSSTCIEKEDFYHALLSTRASPPIPQPIAPEDMIKLQSTLHSTSLTPETRAFNALFGRIFLAFHRTSVLEQEIRTRIQKKIARVQKPAFIASLEVGTIDLGDSAPILSQPRLKDINVSGDITLAFDLRYVGGIRVGIAAVAKIDLGARFKPRSIDLVLSTSVQRVSGRMLIRVKPSPSNRIWFCFESAPEMDVKVEPVVSSRQITYAFILRAIEERIRTVVAETLVKPNWDDVSFFDTRPQRVRGGIWIDEGAPEDVVAEDDSADSAAKTLLQASEKSISMPALSAAVDAMESAASSGSDTATGKASDFATSTAKEYSSPLKRRSLASPPLKHSATMPRPEMAPPPTSTKPLRSPSFNSLSPSTPIVAVDGVSGVPVRADDASVQPKKWRAKGSQQNTNRREAVQAVREVRDRSMPAAVPSGDMPSVHMDSETESAETGSRRPSDASSGRTTHDKPSRADTMRSTASNASSQASRQAQTQRKNLLAATAAATTAARNWGWNAIASRTAGRGGDASSGPRQPLFRGSGATPHVSSSPDQPMGRGQPLPPPGTPLPGPQKGLFAGLGGAVGGKGSMKRKPVLPPRKATTAQAGAGGLPAGLASASGTSLDVGGRHSSEVSTLDDGATIPPVQDEENGVEDDFGPWRENSGRESSYEEREGSLTPAVGQDDIEALLADSGPSAGMAASVDEESQHDETGAQASPDVAAERQVPPPLPARRPARKAAGHVVDAPANLAADRQHDPSLRLPGTPPAASLDLTDDGVPPQDNGYAAALAKYIATEDAVADGAGLGTEDSSTLLSQLEALPEPHAGEDGESTATGVDARGAESKADGMEPVGQAP